MLKSGGMKDKNLKKILFFIFAAALFLRLLAVGMQEESEKVPRSDAAVFDNIAVNIISGHGISMDIMGEKVHTSFRPPFFPLFLAGIYAIFGHNYVIVKIIQAILGAVFCIVIFFITTILYGDKRIGITASILTAVYKPFVSGFNYYGGPAILFNECFYIFILGITILTTLLFIKKETKILGALSGIFICLTILTRFEFIVYPVLLIFYLFYISKLSIKSFTKKYLIMYLFIILTLAPWVARNYIVHGKFVPLSTLGGPVFYMGNNSLANGSSSGCLAQNYIEMCAKTAHMTEYEKDRTFFKEGIKALKDNPKRIPKLIVKKILVHWAPFEGGFSIFNPYYAVILLFGAIGILFFRKRSLEENALLIILLSSTVVAIVTVGDPRYRYPYESLLIIFAALAINKLFINIRQGISANP